MSKEDIGEARRLYQDVLSWKDGRGCDTSCYEVDRRIAIIRRLEELTKCGFPCTEDLHSSVKALLSKSSLIESFGQQLRKLRKARGLTQLGLARLLGISRKSVNLYEKNKRIPDSRTLDWLNG